MTRYIIRTAFDKKGHHAAKSIGVIESDLNKFIQWGRDHQKGRDFVKSTFGQMHYEWDQTNSPRLPVVDFPDSVNPSGIFSKKAVDALGVILEKYGDLHPIIMTTGENYFLYDCWSYVDYEYAKPASNSDDVRILCIELVDDIALPELFCGSKWPGLIVTEEFKKAAEDAGLTGMVFTPIQINVNKSK